MEHSLFDVRRVPFSYFGSWLSLRIPERETELHFCNYHGGANKLFPVQVLSGGKVVRPAISAQPWVLELRHGAGRIEICFASTRTVRMRGQGLKLQFGGKNLTYRVGPNLVTFNKPHTGRYQVEMLHGTMEVQRLEPAQPLYPTVGVVSPAADGRWELAIDQYFSTWVRPPRKSFDDCVGASKRSFHAFLKTMPASRPQDAKARTLAAYIVWASTVEPCMLITRPTVLMSKNWMCKVWSWDQCFNAMALAKGQPALALDQMLILVDHQDEFGAYPDAINDRLAHYNFSKPPVHGWAFSEMLKRMPRPPSAKVMKIMYRSLSRQADWWMTHRRMPGALCPYYLHGNDSGWDNSTMFRKGVPLVAPDLAALLVLQMGALAELASKLGREKESSRWKTRADKLYDGLMRELWRGDHFVARLGLDGTDVESQSLIPWLPVILGKRLPVEVRVALKAGIETHLTRWGLATERVDSPFYKTDGYWRGPIWAPSTFLAVTGLDRCGFTALADTIAERFCRLCAQSGFAENFDAVTGAPLRDPAYTWTASVFLLLAERMKKRKKRKE